MGKACSADLRERLVREVEAGESRRGAADRFAVAPSTVVRVYAWYKQSGSLEPKKQGRPPGSGKLGPHKDFILEHVKRTPDITMPELAALLQADRGVKVDPSNISKFLCAIGYSYKKHFWRRNKSAATLGRPAGNGGSSASRPCARSQDGSSSSTRLR